MRRDVCHSRPRKLHLLRSDRPRRDQHRPHTAHLRQSAPGAGALHTFGALTCECYEQRRRGVFRTIRYLDVTNPFSFEDGSVDYLSCAQLLQHLCPEDAGRCVAEVHPVLLPGGIFRASVPDLDWLIVRYDPQRPDASCADFFEAIQKRDKNGHHWQYNEGSLRQLLAQAEFREIRRRSLREGRCPDLDLLDNRPDGSLFMVAEK